MIVEKVKAENGYSAKCVCDNCNSVFHKKFSRALRGKHQFCSFDCYSKWHVNKNHFNFGKQFSNELKIKLSKGHIKLRAKKIIKPNSYIFIYDPMHPCCNCDGYVREHRQAMEKFLGRYLEPQEVVHHINRNKHDNKIENLMLFKNKSEHQKVHMC